MVVKVTLALFAVAFIIAVAVVAAFWYFNQKDERQHEREMMREEKRRELDEQLVDMAEHETSIEAELEESKR